MKLKKPTSLFKCWLRNRNFTQNTLDTRCQMNRPMWPNRHCRFGGGGKSCRQFGIKSAVTIYPQIGSDDLPPPPKSSNFEQNFKRTQHHALLHKGLFCERPKNLLRLGKTGLIKKNPLLHIEMEVECRKPLQWNLLCEAILNYVKTQWNQVQGHLLCEATFNYAGKQPWFNKCLQRSGNLIKNNLLKS